MKDDHSSKATTHSQDVVSSPPAPAHPPTAASAVIREAQARILPSSDTSSPSISQSPPVKERWQDRKTWNTAALGRRVGVDFLSAAAAGVSVAPVVSIIDRAIIENASGHATILQSAKTSLITALTRPHHFFFAKPLALILMVYGSTYLSANLLDTFLSTVKNNDASKQTGGSAKFMATSATNLSLSLVKDGQFTKMFGAASSAGPVPGPTYFLFMARDSLTVFASFNLPPLLAPKLPMGAGEVMEGFDKYMSRASVAQFLCPAGIQVLSTPLHLLGLDLYNRPNNGITPAMRATKIIGDWGKSCLARVGRIVPAFGVGGVVNREVRLRGMDTVTSESH